MCCCFSSFCWCISFWRHISGMNWFPASLKDLMLPGCFPIHMLLQIQRASRDAFCSSFKQISFWRLMVARSLHTAPKSQLLSYRNSQKAYVEPLLSFVVSTFISKSYAWSSHSLNISVIIVFLLSPFQVVLHLFQHSQIGCWYILLWIWQAWSGTWWKDINMSIKNISMNQKGSLMRKYRSSRVLLVAQAIHNYILHPDLLLLLPPPATLPFSSPLPL